MSTVNWSWSWSAYYGSYTFFFGHHLCILFNNIEKLSVPVQRLQNEQQYSSSLCSVCEKFWLMPVAIWTLSLQGLHAVDEQKGKGFSLALCLHPGKIPTSIEIMSPHAGYLCGGCCCGWKLLWWDQLSLGRTHGGSWAMGEVMQVDNFVQVPLVRKKPGFCITADLGRRNINEQVLITVA